MHDAEFEAVVPMKPNCARASRPDAQKGCQALPGVLRRISLKTLDRELKRVSRFRDVESTFGLNFYPTMMSIRNSRNSLKTRDRRSFYSTIIRGVSSTFRSLSAEPKPNRAACYTGQPT